MGLLLRSTDESSSCYESADLHARSWWQLFVLRMHFRQSGHAPVDEPKHRDDLTTLPFNESSKHMENLVLYGKTIAFLATDGFEQIELTDPWSAIKNAGGTVKLVAPKFDGTIRGVHHDVPGAEFIVDVNVSDANVEEYDACVCDQGLITSRSPEGLSVFCKTIILEFAKGMPAFQPVEAQAHPDTSSRALVE